MNVGNGAGLGETSSCLDFADRMHLAIPLSIEDIPNLKNIASMFFDSCDRTRVGKLRRLWDSLPQRPRSEAGFGMEGSLG